MGSSGKNPPEKSEWKRWNRQEMATILEAGGCWSGIENSRTGWSTRCRAPAFCPPHPQVDSSASPTWWGWGWRLVILTKSSVKSKQACWCEIVPALIPNPVPEHQRPGSYPQAEGGLKGTSLGNWTAQRREKKSIQVRAPEFSQWNGQVSWYPGSRPQDFQPHQSHLPSPQKALPSSLGLNS